MKWTVPFVGDEHDEVDGDRHGDVVHWVQGLDRQIVNWVQGLDRQIDRSNIYIIHNIEIIAG